MLTLVDESNNDTSKIKIMTKKANKREKRKL